MSMPSADPIARRAYKKAYWQAHRAEGLAYGKAYYQAHRAEKLARQKAYQQAHRAEGVAYRKAYRQRHPERFLLNAARQRARRDGLEFSIGIGDIHIPQTCPVLGIPLKAGIGTGGHQPGSPTLDRRDNSKGYVPGNIRVISFRANALKSDGTAEEHRRIAEYMENAK
jgi:hypothetical protein